MNKVWENDDVTYFISVVQTWCQKTR